MSLMAKSKTNWGPGGVGKEEVYTVGQEAQSPVGSWQQGGVLHKVVQRSRTPEVFRRWNHWDLEMDSLRG